jgi:hypothetical protein
MNNTINDVLMGQEPAPPVPTKSEYKPKRIELLREYEINIRFLSVGCLVRVGCKEIAFSTITEAMENINKYVNDPYEETKRWNMIFDSQD